MPKIASQTEWNIAKTILNEKKHKERLLSGFKLSKKNHRQLKHTFLYFKNNQGDEVVVAASRYYYLGCGGEGKVKLVEDENGAFYAIKMMLASVSQGGQESKILNHLGKLLFEGKNKRWYYVMLPFQDGLTLNEYTYICSLTDEQKCAVVYHVAKAIQFLHQQNISHEDIKANNYFINVTNRITVTPIDFNVSSLNSDEAMQEIKCRETRDFTFMLLNLGWRHIKDKLDNETSMDEIVAKFDQFKEIILPIPDSKKRLIEEYTHASNFINKNVEITLSKK